MDINPSFGSGLTTLGEAYSNLGRLAEGVACLEKARQSTPEQSGLSGYLGVAYVRAGRRADAERLLSELEEGRTLRFVSPFALSMCALALDDTERALRWLDTAVLERDGWLGFVPGNPHFAPLRSNPRFVEILRKANLSL